MYKYIFARFIRRRASTRKSHFAYTSVSSAESASRRRRQQQLFSLFFFSVSLSALCSEDESVTHNIKTNFFYFLFICWVNQVLCQCTSRSGYIRSKVEFFFESILGFAQEMFFFCSVNKKMWQKPSRWKALIWSHLEIAQFLLYIHLFSFFFVFFSLCGWCACAIFFITFKAFESEKNIVTRLFSFSFLVNPLLISFFDDLRMKSVCF